MRKVRRAVPFLSGLCVGAAAGIMFLLVLFVTVISKLSFGGL